MNKMFSEYKLVLLFLFLSIALGICFWGLGVTFDHEWFGRGGSLVALFGVAAEYRLSQLQAIKINDKVKGVGGLSGQVIESFDIEKPFPQLRVVSHILVVTGTLIWGFGDLFLKALVSNA